LFRIITRAYKPGVLPGVLFILKKKPEKCKNCRVTSLIKHASKILTKIIYRRLGSRISGLLAEDQFGFRKNRGTREAILCLRMIIEKDV